MTAILRPYIALVLAITLAMSSVTLAVARGQTQSVGQIILCSAGADAVVDVDAQGNPTGPAHVCPDIALTLALGLVAAPVEPAQPALRLIRLEPPVAVETLAEVLNPAPLARGPPAAV